MEFFKYYKKKKPVKSDNRRGYRDVVSTRKGYDIVDTLGGGFVGGKKKIPTVWVKARNGEKWEIPIDPKTGKVPEEYLWARFLAVHQGTRGPGERNVIKDMRVDADVIHEIPKGGFTPEQLIATGWWQYPNESDIMDIDDTGSEAISKELEEAAKSAQNAGRKMILLMPDASAERVRKILAKDFNASELKKSVKNDGLIIKEGNPGRGASGCYVSKQESCSLKTPVIILGKGWDEETLVHEFTHHLRHVDVTRDGLARTPFRMNANGERVNYYRSETNEYNSARNLEEAATVAESYTRAQKIEGATGYYSGTKVHGDSPGERSNYDRKVLLPEGTKPMRGRKAERQVASKFRDTSISHLGYYRPGSNAVNYLDKRTQAGTMPKAIKPVKKKVPDMTKGTTGPVGVGAEATKNRKKYSARKH